MIQNNFTLTTIQDQWKAYQDRLKETIARLTAEQLALRAAPNLRSIGENTAHIIGCRAGWFTQTLGETGNDIVTHWGEKEESAYTADELAQGLDATWHLISDCLARWSDADMHQTFPDDWDGQVVHLSRAWVVWHVLEHDIHHSGEISLTLGMHGLASEFTS